ncbi:MAG: hypothetical protein WAW67_00220 [Candidatus Omnitrophota bacterium]
MPQDNLTPEEKLLKIIENPQTEKRKVGGGGRGIAKVGSLKAAAEAWLKKIRVNKISIKNTNIKIVNKIALALCVILTVFFVFDFISFGNNSLKKISKITAEAAVPEVKAKKINFQKINFAETINLSKKHNIFSFLPPVDNAEQAGNVPLGAQQVINNLKLVGIIWSDAPQAMVENTKEQKTYLLSAGDKIDTLNIKKILRDKIILGKDDKEWELR